MTLIPERLKQFHKEDKVIFFCGAGVSAGPAKLPNFQGLVEAVVLCLVGKKEDQPPTSFGETVWQACSDGRYDEAIGFLESDEKEGYEKREVRDKIKEQLTTGEDSNLDYHNILVRLSDLDKKNGRLVTTNFDDLFERALQLEEYKDQEDKLSIHIAPTLPPGKPSTARGLTYLHGKLDCSPDNMGLVLSVADFGMAYMLEGWARRYVIELFRHYHVVFIGYQVEDPTMRYLVSALAAARMEFKGHFKEPFAFAPYGEGEKFKSREGAAQAWKLKGVEPLPYNVDSDHKELWQGLKKWAESHNPWFGNRYKLISSHGKSPPLDDQDSRIKDMIWTLKDESAAKFFVKQKGEDCPDPGWLPYFQKAGLLSMSMGQYNIDNKPVAAPLVSRFLSDHTNLHKVTHYMVQWIARCLDNKATLDWALEQGGVLNQYLRWQVQKALQQNRDTIPSALLKVWSVLADDDYAHALSCRINQPHPTTPSLGPHNLFAIRSFFNRLRPIPVFNAQSNQYLDQTTLNPNEPENWYKTRIELVGFEDRSELESLKKRAKDWDGTLTVMAYDLTARLKEALDWLQEFGLATPKIDIFYHQYPAIYHGCYKNSYRAKWTLLITLNRDAYDSLAKSDPEQAIHLARFWQKLPYPIFRRLALYAATSGSDSNTKFGLELLLDGQYPALWDLAIQSETLRFLRKRGREISKEAFDRLIETILAGPPIDLENDRQDDEDYPAKTQKRIQLLLFKLVKSGRILPKEAQETFDRLQGESPWECDDDYLEGDDTVSFVVSDINDDDGPLQDFANMTVDKFILWAASHNGTNWWCGGGWREFIEKEPAKTLDILKKTAERGEWPISPWKNALTRDTKKYELNEDIEHGVAVLLMLMPAKSLIKLNHQAALWLEVTQAKLDVELRQKLWRKMWKVSTEEPKPTSDLNLQMSLNHSGGVLGRVLINEMAHIFPQISTGENPGLPSILKDDLEQITSGESPSAKLARVRMANSLVYLFRVDPDWTQRTMFCRMDCDNKNTFDPYIWQGFLWNNQVSEDVLLAIKPQFFKLLANYESLKEKLPSHTPEMFIYLAIPPERGITLDEAKNILKNMSKNSLQRASHALGNIMQGAGDKAPTLWKETMEAWFKFCWPTRYKDRSKEISYHLSRMAIKAGDAFPEVVKVIKDQLLPKMNVFISHDLEVEEEDSGIVTKFPKSSLCLLDKMIGPNTMVSGDSLSNLLNIIKTADKSLEREYSFQRLLNK
ncbi:MAG: SIR2 family protein [Magnetococcales bacterium]|nr:SIR2 family protein [Magnetococcales bacterium]